MQDPSLTPLISYQIAEYRMGQAESVPRQPVRSSRSNVAALEEKFDSFRVRDSEADGVIIERDGTIPATLKY
jgi:hypothetical protein